MAPGALTALWCPMCIAHGKVASHDILGGSCTPEGFGVLESTFVSTFLGSSACSSWDNKDKIRRMRPMVSRSDSVSNLLYVGD